MKNCILISRFTALTLAVLLAVSLISCSGVGVLKPDSEGRYVNEKTGVVYYVAPGYYSVVSYNAEEAVALNDGVNFYAVDGTDNDKWLYSPDFGILLYAEGETIPETLEDFAPTTMNVRLEDDGMMRTVFEEQSKEKISSVLDAYNGEETLRYKGTRANYKFHLEFTSDSHPWLIYNLVYLQYAEPYVTYEENESGESVAVEHGKDFLYNRFDDRFLPIGDEMQTYIDEYYRNTDAE